MNIKKHFRKCHICEAMCGLEIDFDADNQKVLKIQGDKADPFSRGYHCIKAESLPELHNDPDRVTTPMKRVNDQWIVISWDEALDEVAKNINEMQLKYGFDSFSTYLGNPSVHDYGIYLFVPELLKTINSKNNYSATSLDQLPHHLVNLKMLGHQHMFPIPDIDRTDYLLILGANPVVSRGSLMTAPDIKERILHVKKRNGKVIVVDPRKTETASIADDYIEIVPGRDVAFLIAILQSIFTKNLDTPNFEFLSSDEYRELKSYFSEWDVASLADFSGVSLHKITQIASDFAMAKTAVCYGRLGVATQEYGTTCQWLIYLLNIVTGNFDAIGGCLFTEPVIDVLKFLSRGKFNKFQSRVRQLPSFGGEFPSSTLADEILTEGVGQIKGLLSIAGNPVLSAPNSKKMQQALESLEFYVAIDFYINNSTRHAHIVLPPVSPLQRSQFDLVFQSLSIRNNVAFARELFPKNKNEKHSWEIIIELEKRILKRRKKQNLKKMFSCKLRQWLQPEGLIKLGILTGPYGSRRQKNKEHITFSKLEKSIHGLDLGALTSQLPRKLFTKNKKINLIPVEFVSSLKNLANDLKLSETNDIFYLIGRRHLKTNNSWTHNLPLLSKGKSVDHALMNNEDLQRLNIQSGETIKICSEVGSVLIKVIGVTGIKKSVISIPHGFGYGHEGSHLHVAAKVGGVNVNQLNDDKLLDKISGNAVFNGQKVWVEKV